MAEILIRNGRIVDGTGNPWYRGDVRIVEDRIAEIGPRLADAGTQHTIDAQERSSAPGSSICIPTPNIRSWWMARDTARSVRESQRT